ncbi:MAG: ABC transporter ATP-binding protein/permease [Pseudomonadaceae bacterium]|nr:ABC transporter ATP-binding protein/permease [Pseudomonadaceae bacterium]
MSDVSGEQAVSVDGAADTNDSADKRRVSIVAVFRFVLGYWLRVPVKFLLVVIGVFAAIAIEVQVPAQAAALVASISSFADGDGLLDSAWRAAFVLIGLFAAVSLVQQIYLRIWIYLAAEVMQAMINDGFARVQRFSTDWHAGNFAGSTVRKITRGMWAYDSIADLVVVDLGPALLLLFGFAVAMFLRDPLMGSYFFVAVTIFLTVSIVLSLRYVAPANQVSNDADTAMGGALADSVTCNNVVKSFGAETREDAAIDSSALHWRLTSRHAWIRSMNAGLVQTLMILALLGGLLAIVLRSIETGTSPVEDMVYVVTTYFLINSYLRNIGWQVRELQRSVNELDDLVQISQTLPQVDDAPGAPDFVPGAGHVDFQSVSFCYPNQDSAVFDNLTLEIAAGEKVALVGESGAGKSTVIKLLQRLYDTDGGRVVVDGQDIAQVSQASLRQSLALVPQEPILFHRSLADNIGYARPDASREEIIEAAEKAHAHEFVSRLSEGYDTLVGERGVKLSGGERQRVAIARAILADAPMLILDEATSSLDSITEHLIQQAIENLMVGRTAIVVAHRLSTIRAVDRIVVFDRGEIVQTGKHDELIAAGGTYKSLYDMQAFGFAASESMS